jgi:hypothetical protein
MDNRTDEASTATVSQRKDNGSAMDRVGIGPGRGRRHVPRSNLAGASESVRQSYRQDDSKHQRVSPSYRASVRNTDGVRAWNFRFLGPNAEHFQTLEFGLPNTKSATSSPDSYFQTKPLENIIKGCMRHIKKEKN